MFSRLSPAQIRAALGLLDWRGTDLAAAAGVAPLTISRILRGTNKPQEETAEKIRQALTARDIVFLPNNGVALYPETVTKLAGPRALNDLLDDVYATVKNGGRVYVTGTDETLYEKYHHEEIENEHVMRMSAIKDKVDFRVILRHGDQNFSYDSYVTYRWMPQGKFKDNPFYLYNHKLAFIKVTADGPEVLVHEMPSMAEAFRDLFEIVWEQCSLPEKRKP